MSTAGLSRARLARMHDVMIGWSSAAVPGRYGWDGGLGTSWDSDPREEMVIVLMTQCAWASPSPPNVYFWTLAYQAIDD